MENEIACSILTSLVTSEDKILDMHSMCRADSTGQTGGSSIIEENLIVLTSEPAHHSERESVLQFLAWKKKNRSESFSSSLLHSPLLELYQSEEDRSDFPTPLHGVGTWKQPLSPSSTSRIRLIDAAIHTFAATFGMQDGRSQETAMKMLQAMLPAPAVQNSRGFGVSSSLIADNEKKTRVR